MAVNPRLCEELPVVGCAEQIPPLCVGGRDAARLLGISERHLSDFAVSGEIPSFMLGGRRLYRVASLDEWARQREQAEKSEKSS